MRVPVTDLVRRPGATRTVLRDVDAGTVTDDDLLAEVDGPLGLDLDLESVVEGILVRGTLAFDLRDACARCLAPVETRHRVVVAELFVDPGRRDPDVEVDPGYEIAPDLDAIDLSTLIRDTVSMAAPVRVLCRRDCRGLCPECGADRNVADCGHRQVRHGDPRWAKLADLDLTDAAAPPPDRG